MQPPSDPDVPCEHWAAWRAVQPAAPGRAELRQCAAFWQSWCRWLAQAQRPWHAATPAQVAQYLQRERRPIARQRCAWVLAQVYDHAVRQGWTAANPAAAHSPPVARPADAGGIALPEPARDAFVAVIAAEPASTADPVARRDLVLVLLLAVEALAISEAINVRLADLRPSASRPATLRVDGPRRAQQRENPLDARTVRAIAQWLDVAQPRMPLPAAQQPLLPDTRGTAWSRPLSRHGGFKVVRKALALASARGALPLVQAEAGPRLLRNSAVLAWLQQGMAPAEVQRRAGLQRLDGLDRIALAMAGGPARERFEAQRRAAHDR